jgi:hypothetical protein
MDSITKILDAENRASGKYDALPFIKNIKRFKSVELYIASLETKVPDNPSSKPSRRVLNQNGLMTR